MKIHELTVILRRDKRNRIVAIVEQMTSEGMKQGANLLKGKKPNSFMEAKTMVQVILAGKVDEIRFLEQSVRWE